jgi:hypothetical protein
MTSVCNPCLQDMVQKMSKGISPKELEQVDTNLQVRLRHGLVCFAGCQSPEGELRGNDALTYRMGILRMMMAEGARDMTLQDLEQVSAFRCFLSADEQAEFAQWTAAVLKLKTAEEQAGAFLGEVSASSSSGPPAAKRKGSGAASGSQAKKGHGSTAMASEEAPNVLRFFKKA